MFELESRIRLKSIQYGGHRISMIYQKKAVMYGNVIEVYEYEKPQISFKRVGEPTSARRAVGTRAKGSINRARSKLFRLVEGNVRRHGSYPPVFVTLTFAENLQDLGEANAHFKTYMKRLNYFLRVDLKYVAVPEFQERGAVHFHLVFFNLPYIDKFDLENIWGHGFTNIQVVKNVRSMGAYLAKYFAKSAHDPRLFGKKSYTASRGIYRPVDIYGAYEVDSEVDRAMIIDISENKYQLYNHKKILCKL